MLYAKGSTEVILAAKDARCYLEKLASNIDASLSNGQSGDAENANAFIDVTRCHSLQFRLKLSNESQPELNQKQCTLNKPFGNFVG